MGDTLAAASWWGDSGPYGDWVAGHGQHGMYGDSPDVMIPGDLLEAYLAADAAKDAAREAIDAWLDAHPECTLPLPVRAQPEWIDITDQVRTVPRPTG